MTPISIHPPARGGTSIIFTCYQIIKISIHPPARGGTLRTFIKVENYVFQSTHPQGVGRFFALVFFSHVEFQSTHPQGVGQTLLQNSHCSHYISIHPPARGGTVVFYMGNDVVDISIHPPARGGTAKVHKTNFAFYTKSTKIALPFSLYQTLSSFYFPIACYLAHSSGANHAYYFCSLPLRTARPLKYFTSYNRLWQ